MAGSHLVIGIEDIEARHPELLGIALQSMDGLVTLGMHPEMGRELALLLLRELHDGTNRGILPPQLDPVMEVATTPEPTPTGILVTYDLSGGLRMESEMPWPVARELAEKLIDLCDDHESGRSSLN
jgi:hypothetical protein